MIERDMFKVREQPLPTGLITKGVITDSENRTICFYEDWLRELLNSSKSFMSKTGGEEFSAPVGESHGEADAITSRYEIDFKIVLGQSWLHALREKSRQILDLGTGVACKATGRRQDPMQFVKLHKRLRGLGRERLLTLWHADMSGLGDIAERDVASFLKTLDKDKNLLLLLPSLLYTDNGAEVDPSVASAAVYSDYKESVILRTAFHPSRETYLAYFLAHNLVIIEASGIGWNQFDIIPTSSSKTFVRSCSYYFPLGYAQIGLLT